MIDYHWFYSALTQSLAALIGIIGVFVVYTLQAQRDEKKDIQTDLKKYLLFLGKCFNHTCNFTVEGNIKGEAEVIKEKLSGVISGLETQITRVNKQLNSSGVLSKDIPQFEADTRTINVNLKPYKEWYKELENKINILTKINTHTSQIKTKGLETIKNISFTFVICLICLLLSGYLKEHPPSSVILAIIILFLTIAVLYEIIRFCRVAIGGKQK